MARYTKAYSAFKAKLSEVNTLRSLACNREKRDPINSRDEINALSRGSIVLLCSHLEAYIKELGEIALDSMHTKSIPRTRLSSKIYYHISKDLLDEIKSTSDPERIGDKIFKFLEDDLLYWSRDGAFPKPIPTDRFNKGFSNPAFEKIRRYMRRFGYDGYQGDLSQSLMGSYQPTINLVNHLVDTRNKIAHGDPQANKTPSDLSGMITTTMLFCRSTDQVFASWWKRQFCSIR